MEKCENKHPPKKIHLCVSSAKDLTVLQLFDSCVKVLNNRIEFNDLEPEVWFKWQLRVLICLNPVPVNICSCCQHLGVDFQLCPLISELSIFSLYQLIVSALKCAAFHLMWAKRNAVYSTPTEVCISWHRLHFCFHIVCPFLPSPWGHDTAAAPLHNNMSCLIVFYLCLSVIIQF